jgi:hypothetical protein
MKILTGRLYIFLVNNNNFSRQNGDRKEGSNILFISTDNSTKAC